MNAKPHSIALNDDALEAVAGGGSFDDIGGSLKTAGQDVAHCAPS